MTPSVTNPCSRLSIDPNAISVSTSYTPTKALSWQRQPTRPTQSASRQPTIRHPTIDLLVQQSDKPSGSFNMPPHAFRDLHLHLRAISLPTNTLILLSAIGATLVLASGLGFFLMCCYKRGCKGRRIRNGEIDGVPGEFYRY